MELCFFVDRSTVLLINLDKGFKCCIYFIVLMRIFTHCEMDLNVRNSAQTLDCA